MGIKKAKKITTNAIVYLSFSALIAGWGLYKSDMACLAFAMWMIQMANFFKKDKTKSKRKKQADAAANDVAVEGIDVSH